jgi:hypothetical protein
MAPMKHSRNPYGNTKKRKAALAWMAARGIDQPRGVAYVKRPKPDVTVIYGKLRIA